MKTRNLPAAFAIALINVPAQIVHGPSHRFLSWNWQHVFFRLTDQLSLPFGQSKPVRTHRYSRGPQPRKSQMTKPKPDSLPSGTPARSSCACRKQPKTLTNPFCDRLFED